MATVYVAGSIHGLDAREAVERFNIIENRLRAIGFNVRNPVRGKKISNVALDFLPYEPNEIVHRDLADIDNSDYVLAFMAMPSIGTSMEIIYARLIKRIPVIIITTNPEVRSHPWISVFKSKIVESIDEAIPYLEDWYLKGLE